MDPVSIFGGIVSLLKAIPIIDGWFRQFMAYYLAQQERATLAQIQDAAAASMRAQSDEERFKAARQWQAALSRPRVS